VTARRTHRGADDAKTRLLLIDTTERLMLEEGYAAVTSRRVATEAGVTAPLVHYYFPTLDELFLAVVRRRADEQLVRQARLLATDEPLRAMWRFHSDPRAAAFLTELMALANHRKSIAGEIAAVSGRFRLIEIDALERAAEDGRVDLHGVPAGSVVTLLSVTAHGLVNERAFGLTIGHDEISSTVDRLLAAGTGDPSEEPAPAGDAPKPPRSVVRRP
jgi:AcrR family transcriptional regulator